METVGKLPPPKKQENRNNEQVNAHLNMEVSKAQGPRDGAQNGRDLLSRTPTKGTPDL